MATDYSEAPIPQGTDAALVPADLQAYADHIDTQLVLRASSEADRDARYGDVPNGTIVVHTGDATEWIKVPTSIDASGWVTHWRPTTPWTNCSLGAGTLQGPIQIRGCWLGGKLRASMRGVLSKVDSSPISAETMAGGTVLVTVPSMYIPTGYLTSFLPMGVTMSLEGIVSSVAARAQMDTSTGEIIVFGQQDANTGGTPYIPATWIAFDDIEYWVEE